MEDLSFSGTPPVAPTPEANAFLKKMLFWGIFIGVLILVIPYILKFLKPKKPCGCHDNDGKPKPQPTHEEKVQGVTTFLKNNPDFKDIATAILFEEKEKDENNLQKMKTTSQNGQKKKKAEEAEVYELKKDE